MKITDAVADFVVETGPGDIPDDLRWKMRMHLVDTLAAGIGGSTAEHAVRVRNACSAERDGHGRSALWGRHGSVDARSAALVNGVAAHALELDDTGGCDHSGAVVFPAVLAMCSVSQREVSIDEVVVAAALGYEFGRRVQFFLGGYPALNQRGWHSTSVCGPIGAAAAATKIMRLSRARTADAIGIATSMMAGSWSSRTGGGDNKVLHAGLAAANGVDSARLADCGVRGTRDAFEDTWGGAARLYAGGRADIAALTSELGSRWVAYDASVKAFPSCASSHRMVQLAERVLVPRRYDPDRIERIEIRLGPVVAGMCGETRANQLASFKQRQLSIPYTVALTLIRGALTLEELGASPPEVPGIETLLEKTRVVVDPDVTNAHGEGTITVMRGDGSDRFSTDDIADPRFNITTMEQVLTKAEATLSSAGMESSLSVLRSIADADGGDSAQEALSAV